MRHIVICGGGISGLYCAYLLRAAPYRITILEASNRLGGRVKSHDGRDGRGKSNDGQGKSHTQDMSVGFNDYEIGAGRFSTKHHLLMDLIKTANLTDMIKPLHKGHSYFLNDTWIPDDKALLRFYGVKSTFPKLWSIIADNYLSWSGIGRLSLPFLLQRELGEPAANAIIRHIGYQDIVRTNSRLTLDTLLDSYDIRGQYQFNVLRGGLEQLIVWLKSNLGKNTKVLLNSPVKDIKRTKTGYFVSTDNDLYECDDIVVALTHNACMSIPFLNNHLEYTLQHIMPLPLMRIYATFPTPNPWFKGLRSIITDLPIEYIIPINEETGLIMISYVDYKNVEYMRRLIRNNGLTEELLRQVSHILKRPIPNPISIDFYDWTEGIHGFRPNTSWNHIQDEIEELAQQNIYIAGEMISKTAQGWIEGALSTAQDAAHRLLQSGGAAISLQDVSKNKWIAIRGMVYDVSGFINQHPGGANIYKGIGRDHTAKWNAVHSNAIFNSHLATEDARKRYGIKLIGRLA